jgi:hypothetical protein
MTKIFVLVAAFFISLVVNASGEIAGTVCPSNLSCDYESGVCDKPLGWVLDSGGAVEDFLGQNPVGLSKIMGYKEGSSNDPYPYSIRCYYSYGDHSVISIYTYVKTLIGDNWVFSGFGKNKAECSDIADPTTCAGSSRYNGAIAPKVHLQQISGAGSLTDSSCKNACKRMHIRYLQGTQYFYCLPKSEAPSGWGWMTEGNPNAALPLCECSHVKGATCS